MSSKERKALGKGFGALLQSVETSKKKVSGNLVEINLADVSFNPKQPRAQIDPERLEELAQSIKIKGVIQPVLVRPGGEGLKKYELIAGERRLRASKLAGFDRIPAVIRSIPDSDIQEIAIIENIQRDDLNALEESIAYQNLLEEHGYTQEDLSKRIGKSRSAISNQIRLLKLPAAIQKDISNNKLSAGHARALLSTENSELQDELHRKIILDDLSVRESEKLAKVLRPHVKQKEESSQTDQMDAQMQLNQKRLEEHFMTKVKIKPKGKKGSIEIEYYSEDDFNRIFSEIFEKK